MVDNFHVTMVSLWFRYKKTCSQAPISCGLNLNEFRIVLLMFVHEIPNLAMTNIASWKITVLNWKDSLFLW